MVVELVVELVVLEAMQVAAILYMLEAALQVAQD
jgi:hypothetical protein